ncbi:MAG TPA: tryptophan-rich sensory protein [Candidatus Coprosoma intestinipullorum]|uniref:Tryptophan-rich sensory protein n=1 Tax=Candidatus Coprosoma intestinipullorum TaxID=2840752 RepID=A0A9D0ZPT1_9FIRM|nr:tryptophan-rich sensory protein [Candidatus Coprosoma intestinipullorum]
MNKFKLFIDILIPVAIGGIVGFIINPYIDYNSLVQPPLSPPSIVFPIVWTILYVLMGISYYLLKNPSKKEKIIYFVQLGVNALWSLFFFIGKFYLFSFIWIILLDVLVIFMIGIFYQNSKISGYLQIPYLIWILFATYLNLGIYVLN